MRPLVGMTMSYRLEGMWSLSRDNSEAIWMAGGLPVALPYRDDEENIKAYAQRLDGLVLTGGNDIDPHLFGEEPILGLGEVEPERDRVEIALVREIVDQGKPILAICRGCQILAIALGGDMYQDLGSQREGILQHSQRAPRSHPSHSIRIRTGSRLYRLAGGETVRVNSFHHQAVRQVPDGCAVVATAPDGVVEAFEWEGDNFIVGVQWHPENMMPEDPFAFKLFSSFIAACVKQGEKKAIPTAQNEG
ncbi:gamma-glutamyl-gamma-aminobutyrate hydrolase family protein [Desmospora activa]|uniref:Putative glutamine amidotransferase n=1 Tax=Desmospora activa DSM 45169 TaxID=1121389 RepID=A0A2T4ZBP0_9BACL|nr:gamma-glutamyl-gamma-aminobutyrate hydrolase family protein [Desmospora activa]PTM59321.1 putative glutamine amidotransferase [Desmospora activa DSM 45169]